MGASLDGLRRALAIDTAGTEWSGDCEISKTVYGAVYRANFIAVLGRNGTNAANLLAGLLGEDCAATALVCGQGIRRGDVVDYVTHGVPRVVPDRHELGVLWAIGGEREVSTAELLSRYGIDRAAVAARTNEEMST